MSFTTIRRDIFNRFEANWVTTPIAYQNIPYKPSFNQPWVKINLFDESSSRINVGLPAIYRQVGTVIIEIHTEDAKGIQEGRGYGDTIAAIFRDQQFSGLTFSDVNVTAVGKNNGYWQTNVIAPFYWDGTYP